MQMVQPLQQPTAVGPHQRSHIGHRADAKQIPGHADGFWFVQNIGNGMGQHIGQPHAGESAVRRALRGGGRMNERSHGRPLRRDRVVIGHDHLHRQTCGQFEGFPRGNTVINGDQQSHAIVVEPLHHGGIEAISLLHPRGDSGFRLSTQRGQRPQ